MVSENDFNKYMDAAQIKRELDRITDEDSDFFPREQHVLMAKYASMVRLLRRVRRIELEATTVGKQRPVISIEVLANSKKQTADLWILDSAETEGVEGPGFRSVQEAFSHLEDFESEKHKKKMRLIRC